MLLRLDVVLHNCRTVKSGQERCQFTWFKRWRMRNPLASRRQVPQCPSPSDEMMAVLVILRRTDRDPLPPPKSVDESPIGWCHEHPSTIQKSTATAFSFDTSNSTLKVARRRGVVINELNPKPGRAGGSLFPRVHLVNRFSTAGLPAKEDRIDLGLAIPHIRLYVIERKSARRPLTTTPASL